MHGLPRCTWRAFSSFTPMITAGLTCRRESPAEWTKGEFSNKAVGADQRPGRRLWPLASQIERPTGAPTIYYSPHKVSDKLVMEVRVRLTPTIASKAAGALQSGPIMSATPSWARVSDCK